MDWTVAIIVGALIGWIGSMLVTSNAEQSTLPNMLIGIIGAVIGKWVFGDILGIGSATAVGGLNYYGIMFGVLGAAILVAILRAFRVYA